MGVRGDVAAVAVAVAAAAAVVDAAAAAATTTTTTFNTPGNETAAYDRNCRIHSKWLSGDYLPRRSYPMTGAL